MTNVLRVVTDDLDIDIASANEYRHYLTATARCRLYAGQFEKIAIARLQRNLDDLRGMLDFHKDVCQALMAKGAAPEKLKEYTTQVTQWAGDLALLNQHGGDWADRIDTMLSRRHVKVKE